MIKLLYMYYTDYSYNMQLTDGLLLVDILYVFYHNPQDIQVHFHILGKAHLHCDVLQLVLCTHFACLINETITIISMQE